MVGGQILNVWRPNSASQTKYTKKLHFGQSFGVIYSVIKIGVVSYKSTHLLSISIFCYLLLCFLFRYLQFWDYFNKFSILPCHSCRFLCIFVAFSMRPKFGQLSLFRPNQFSTAKSFEKRPGWRNLAVQTAKWQPWQKQGVNTLIKNTHT